MKKTLLITAFVLTSLLSVSAQNFEKGNSMINLSLGLGSYFTSGSGYNTTIPPIEGSYEYMVSENISGGAFVGVYGSKYETNFDLAFNFSSKFSYIYGGVLGNYHFVNDDKFNAYAGIKLGYTSASTSTGSNNDDYLDELLETIDFTSSGLLYGVQIGGRYFISEKFAINAELGYGISVLKIGVTYKI